MKIKQVRVDSRLIHGQVATFWTNFLEINRIIVISNEVVKDKLQIDMLRLSCPSSCKLSVLKISTAVNNVNNNKYSGDNILIIIPNIDTMISFIQQSRPLSSDFTVNLGNIPKKENTIKITKTVNLQNSEIECILKLVDSGQKVIMQMIPTAIPLDFKQSLDDDKKEVDNGN